MSALFHILALGFADRLRGSGWFQYNHIAGQILMGVVVAEMLHASDPLFFVYVISAVAIGSAPGWSNPLGAAFDGRPMANNGPYEWWQIGILRRSTIAALAVRGFMWGALLAPVSLPATVAFTLAFVIAPYAVRRLPKFWPDMWAVMEFSRGALVAILITIMS